MAATAALRLHLYVVSGEGHAPPCPLLRRKTPRSAYAVRGVDHVSNGRHERTVSP